MLMQVEAYRRDVGSRLKALRESKNWSQEDAAHAVGVTTSTWGRWERGTRAPYESNWRRISQVFGEDDAREARGVPPPPLGLGAPNSQAADLEARLVRIEEKLDELVGLISGNPDVTGDLFSEVLKTVERGLTRQAREAGLPSRQRGNGQDRPSRARAVGE